MYHLFICPSLYRYNLDSIPVAFVPGKARVSTLWFVFRKALPGPDFLEIQSRAEQGKVGHLPESKQAMSSPPPRI